MGNLLPLDGAKKQQCEEIAKEFLATFNIEYVLAYGVEFIKMKIKQIDKEAYRGAKMKKELMYRKNVTCTEPHKMGPLTKKGAIIKNWKHRYFVVNPDFSVSYYETEEAYHKHSKPKGVMYLAGYEAAESADNTKIEQLKALAKKLGVDEESLPLPEKFPPHTFALSHERRRDYFITAADEEDKKEWVEMFKTCCRKARGFKNEDPVAQKAFKTAYRRACYESSWYRWSVPRGTEEQVLTETLVEIINCRVLSSVYSGLTGNYTIRRKVSEQVMKTLDSMVLAMVVPAYKGLVETTEKMKAPVEKMFNEKKDEIVEVQKKITQQLADKMESIMNKVFKEASADMKKLYEDLKELTGRSSTEMRNECVVRLMERIVKDTKESQDVAPVMKKHYRTFDGVTLRTCAWDHWYKVYNIEKEAIGIINKYKGTFELPGDYSYVYASHDMLAKVADAAFYTFEQILEERTKETDILKDNNKASEVMGKVKDDVIRKYDADSKITPQEVSFKLTTTHIVEYVSKKIDPLTKDILKNLASAIPEPLKQIISVQDRYELYLEECIKELIRRANGIAKPPEKGEGDTKESEKPENGEMKIDTPKSVDKETKKVMENELEEQKVEENVHKVKESEVQVNGKTAQRGESDDQIEKDSGHEVEGTQVKENGLKSVESSEQKESDEQKVEDSSQKVEGTEAKENGLKSVESNEQKESDGQKVAENGQVNGDITESNEEKKEDDKDEELKENEGTKNENRENGEATEKKNEEKQENEKPNKLDIQQNNNENSGHTTTM